MLSSYPLPLSTTSLSRNTLPPRQSQGEPATRPAYFNISPVNWTDLLHTLGHHKYVHGNFKTEYWNKLSQAETQLGRQYIHHLTGCVPVAGEEVVPGGVPSLGYLWPGLTVPGRWGGDDKDVLLCCVYITTTHC